MPVIRRQIVAEVTIGGEVVEDFLGLRVSNSLSAAFAKAQIVCAHQRGTYNDDVEIKVGAIPGNGLLTRFKGKRRRARFDLFPRNCTIECIGVLGLAAEYTNTKDPHAAVVPNISAGSDIFVGWGGMTVQDLVPGSTHFLGTATLKEIAEAVLTQAGVPYDAANFDCSGRLYGMSAEGIYLNYIWKAGSVALLSADGTAAADPKNFRKQGQTALSYLGKYCQVDAEYDPGPPEQGGFFRLFEGLDGQIKIVRVGGRPRGDLAIDPGSGREMIFTEGGSVDTATQQGVEFAPAPGTVNILSANIDRDYPLGNRTLVLGRDSGYGFQVHFEAHSSNPFMSPDQFFYDPSPPSSDWIEWGKFSSTDSAEKYVYSNLPSGQEFGMDCETVARARLMEVNRETVSGTLTTFEDWAIEPAQIHLVQGPAGIPDRLQTGEKLWCQGNDFDLEVQGGAPVLSQTPSYLGGGLPDELVQPLAREVVSEVRLA